MLNFDGSWRYDTPGPIPPGVIQGFADLIKRIVTQGNRHQLLEHFNKHFAWAAKIPFNRSSSPSWAESDLETYMNQASKNAALFIEAFYNACGALQQSDIILPDLSIVNRVLLENHAGYEIAPPDLLARNPRMQIALPERTPSLDEQAQELINNSLNISQKLLLEGRNRQAVQEILWLLETVSTAFKGLDAGAGTVQGQYFNKIVADLRRHKRGTTLDQVLGWITMLHGFLSSPTGGGIRHGTDFKVGIDTDPSEARLFCNLTRSYIDFLLTEYERLSR